MSSQSDASRRVYASRRLVRTYAARAPTVAERAVLADLRGAIAGARVLELGCGAGAITRELLALTDTLVGVDISPAMVEHCRSTFSQGTFLVGELGDLLGHAQASYDVVVAAANLLDVATHDERPRVLAGLRRVLAPGGVLYFSSHNRNSTAALRQAAHGPTLRLTRSPYRLMRSVAAYVVGTVNHHRLARHQRFESEYAIINDSAHRFGLLHHYITRAAQERQLAEAGFELVAVYGMDGRRLAPSDDDAEFTELHYVARAGG